MKKFILSMFAATITAAACVAQGIPSLTASPKEVPGIDFTFAPENVAQMKAPARAGEAQQGLDFTLAYQVYGALKLNVQVGTEIYQVFEFTDTYCEMYAGKTIKSINLTSGVTGKTQSQDITDVVVFITDDLDKEFSYSQKGKIGTTAYTLNKIELDEPYTIEAGKPFFVGFMCKPVSNNTYYVVVDGVPRESPDGAYVGYKQGTEIKWQNCASQYGNLCMGVTIVGDNMPENGLNLYGIETPAYVEPGKEFEFRIGFVGAAINKAESVEVEYTIGNQAPETVKVPFKSEHYLGYNEVGIYKIGGLVCNEQGLSVPFTAKITKVNDKDNTAPDNVGYATLQCYDRDKGFKRHNVVEEGTGTWCGWCPAGIVMMEYLRDNYPEDFIRVAIHGQDEMTVSSTNSVLGLFPGFPGAYINRVTEIPPTNPQVIDIIDEYYATYKDVPSICGFDKVEVTVKDDKNISILSTSRFAFDVKNDDRYRLAYYVTEDNVGPYSQSNYYAGGANGKMGGWESKGSRSTTMYDDVARYLVGGISGLNNSLPDNLVAGESYDNTEVGFINNVKGDLFYVTAMIVDSKTNEVVNAKQVMVSKSGGVNDIATTALTVRGTEGGIVFGGEYEMASVYNVAGQLVATVRGESSVALPAGLYIVKADGTTAKVMVK